MPKSPQCEDGFTRIANELLEAMCKTNFNQSETKIILFIIRKTWGFRLKEAIFKPGEISKGTGLDRQSVYKITMRLKRRKIVKVVYLDYGAKISINKHYDKWVDVVSLDYGNSVVNLDYGRSQFRLQHLIKENLKKDLSARARASIGADFGVTDEMRGWFGEQNFKFIDLYSATQDFIDYHKTKGTESADWMAEWRNGIRLREKWASERNQNKDNPYSRIPTCPHCQMNATNIIKGQDCPYCNKLVT